MSHYGTPPPDGSEGDDREPPEPPGGAHAADPAAYNPYPDNWEAPGSGAPAFVAGAPHDPAGGVPAPPGPYGQPDPYGTRPPQNPYSTARPDRPTFGFGGYAGWFTRVGASLVDGIVGAVAGAPLWVGYIILLSNTTTTTNPDGTTSAHFAGSLAVPIVLIAIGIVTQLAFFVWNICIRQGRTGASIGKSVLAIRLVNSDFQPIGAGWCFLRSILHIVDAIPCYIGYLWPIWDSQKQTFADKILSSYVIQATTEQPRPY